MFGIHTFELLEQIEVVVLGALDLRRVVGGTGQLLTAGLIEPRCLGKGLLSGTLEEAPGCTEPAARWFRPNGGRHRPGEGPRRRGG